MKDDETLDLLWGVRSIAAEINKPLSATYHLLEQRRLPARKEGKLWVASRRGLRKHYADLIEGEVA